jgi:hypothetical protein
MKKTDCDKKAMGRTVNLDRELRGAQPSKCTTLTTTVRVRPPSYINLQPLEVSSGSGSKQILPFPADSIPTLLNCKSKVTAIPDGWTEVELQELNKSVQNVSFVFRFKAPNYTAMKVIKSAE